jgi:glutamine synthetase
MPRQKSPKLMKAQQIRTADDARALVNQRGLSHVKVGVTDIDGVIRGKYMAREKFFSALKSGFNFCDVVFGWDSSDQLYDKSVLTGWHTGFPDAPVRIDPTTARDVPLEGDMLFFLGDFVGPTAAVCPRSLLQRVISKAADMGFAATAAAEFEFFVFDETPHSVREKGYRNLKNLTPGWFGYSMLRSSVESEFY